ncbi:SDR family NAD(P)-dependent oxidoreductase, partial [bacterium]|nr:SDR family NAD(P)-dependent oxidoreductase [bacterium]
MADKVALVTGGSRGIGAAIALRLAGEGAAVAVNYSGSEAAALSVVDAIVGSGGRAIAVRADVGDAADCARLVATTISELDGLHIVVNNAGITRDGLIVRMSDSDWDDVIRTNLGGVFAITRAATRRLMKQREGSIINIASVVG